MSNYKYYTVKDIESIGTDIQSDISTSMQECFFQTLNLKGLFQKVQCKL